MTFTFYMIHDAKVHLTLFPTVTVRIWLPSSFETQSNITIRFGAAVLGVFPILLMYLLTPSKVDILGTEVRPTRLDHVINLSVFIHFNLLNLDSLINSRHKYLKFLRSAE